MKAFFMQTVENCLGTLEKMDFSLKHFPHFKENLAEAWFRARLLTVTQKQ